MKACLRFSTHADIKFPAFGNPCTSYPHIQMKGNIKSLSYIAIRFSDCAAQLAEQQTLNRRAGSSGLFSATWENKLQKKLVCPVLFNKTSSLPYIMPAGLITMH